MMLGGQSGMLTSIILVLFFSFPLKKRIIASSFKWIIWCLVQTWDMSRQPAETTGNDWSQSRNWHKPSVKRQIVVLTPRLLFWWSGLSEYAFIFICLALVSKVGENKSIPQEVIEIITINLQLHGHLTVSLVKKTCFWQRKLACFTLQLWEGLIKQKMKREACVWCLHNLPRRKHVSCM